jgi:hypothetical protein
MIPCADPHTIGLPSRNRSQGTVPMIDLSLMELLLDISNCRYVIRRVDHHFSL